MRPLWTSQDTLLIGFLEAFLKDRGFQVTLVGEHKAGVAGLLPPNECWYELTLLDPEQEAQARESTREFFSSDKNQYAAWVCEKCGEVLEPQFTDCWRCGSGLVLDNSSVYAAQSRLRCIILIQVLLLLANFMLQKEAARSDFSNVLTLVETTGRRFASDTMAVFLGFHLLLWLSYFGLLVNWNPARFLYLALWLFAFLMSMADGWSTSLSLVGCIQLGIGIFGLVILTLVWFTGLRNEFQRV